MPADHYDWPETLRHFGLVTPSRSGDRLLFLFFDCLSGCVKLTNICAQKRGKIGKRKKEKRKIKQTEKNISVCKKMS